jgi:hypothetical protein
VANLGIAASLRVGLGETGLGRLTMSPRRADVPSRVLAAELAIGVDLVESLRRSPHRGASSLVPFAGDRIISCQTNGLVIRILG